MLITDWMTAPVMTISPTASLLHCRELFKEHHIGRLPVVDAENTVVGLISNEAIRAFSPQHTTGLEILELLDLLSETKVKELMAVAPETIHYQGTIGHAAQFMVSKAIFCLPVVDDNDKLIGILTQWDIFKALVSISGADMPSGVEMSFILENKQGPLSEIIGSLTELGVRISTVLSSLTDDDKRHVKVSFWSDNPEAEDAAFEQLRNHPQMRFWARQGKMFQREIR